MINYIYIISLLFTSYICRGQATLPSHKQYVKPEDFDTWNFVSQARISNNGKYFGYITEINSSQTLIVRGLKNNWCIKSSILGPYEFTSDNQTLIWININDSLCISHLGTSEINYIPNVTSFTINNTYLTYELKNRHRLEVRALSEKSPLSIYSENALLVSNRDDSLWISIPEGKEQTLSISKKNGKSYNIYKGARIQKMVIDNINKQIALLPDSFNNTLLFFKVGMNSVVNIPIVIDSNLLISGLLRFSQNGKSLFIEIEERNEQKKRAESSAIVWSYLDSELQSQQINNDSRKYIALLRIEDKTITRLDKDNDWLLLPKYQDTIALIRQQKVPISGDEVNWNRKSHFNWKLVSLNSYHTIDLPDIQQNSIVQISPYGKYVIYYDNNVKNYFSYNTLSGKKQNITLGITENWEKKKDDESYGRYISGWQVNDEYVYINGYRDIWQIDPEGRKKPLNLTNGYGLSNNTIFSFALEEYSHRAFKKSEVFILAAFNLNTKYNGFYKKIAGRRGNPDSLTMGPYIYCILENPSIPNELNYSPIKALNKTAYIVKRMCSTEAPNYYYTRNFKSFKRISNINPQTSYNWYESELHTWKSMKGRDIQGILYKPQNFDSLKRYPVIFNIYEKKTDGLNAYLRPKALENGGSINIPYYVSNGYIIFTPDIYYPIGDPMDGTFDAVISAVKYINQLPYIDSTKVGIQASSWGGMQVNYLIANSSCFAAACSASGLANWPDSYNSLMASGESMQGIYESGQFRIGATLWERPSTFIKNSALFYADQINTPILFMHTKNDGLFPINNILSIYYRLHVLKKKHGYSSMMAITVYLVKRP